MQAAEKYLSQGKISQAINEYVTITEKDPSDANVLNILGDLYVRNNSYDEAFNCFRKLADYYEKQGFSQKAIAIYNKMARLQPNSVELSAKLAPLYESKGMIAEARDHYNVVAEHLQKSGKQLDALKIWQQMADLDPYSTDIWLRIGESYHREKMTEEAAGAFLEAGRRFAVKNQHEAAIKALTNALSVKPYDLPVTEALVSSQIKLGMADEAVGQLEKILQEDPSQLDFQALLLSCHIDLNQPAQAEKTVISLVEKEPSNYRKFLDVVELHLKNLDLDGAARVLNMCNEHLLVGGQGNELKFWINEILSRDPENLAGLGLLARTLIWQREESEIPEALQRLNDAAAEQGNSEEEVFALNYLVGYLPHESRYSQRLRQLTGFTPPVSEPTTEVEITAEPSTDEEEVFQPDYEGDFAPSADDLSPESSDDIPTFESFENLSLVDEEVDEAAVKDFGLLNPETSAEAGEDLGGNHADFEEMRAETSLEGEYFSSSDDLESEIDINAEIPAKVAEQSIPEDITQTALPELTETQRKHLEQELESVDFYLDEGYVDLARQTLETLVKEFGSQPEIAKRYETLGIINFSAQNLSPSLAEESKTENAEEAYIESEAVSDFAFVGTITETLAAAEETEVSEETYGSSAEQNLSLPETATDLAADKTTNSAGKPTIESAEYTEARSGFAEIADDDDVVAQQMTTQPATESSTDPITESAGVIEGNPENLADQESVLAAENAPTAEELSLESADDSLAGSTDEATSELIAEPAEENTGLDVIESGQSFDAEEEPSQVEAAVTTEEISISAPDLDETQNGTAPEKSAESQAEEEIELLLKPRNSENDEFLGAIASNGHSDDEVNEFAFFEEFKEELGLEEGDSLSAGDYETHYNLGIAYKEMGLYDDAAKEFQEAVKLSAPEADGRNYLQCCHALGYCFMQMSLPKLAQMWFEKGLESKDLSADERQALMYEIATTHESLGEYDHAGEIYAEIYAVSVDYRDVRDRLGNLKNLS